jgi:hypothetical protein
MDRAVGIATHCGLDSSGIESRWRRFFPCSPDDPRGSLQPLAQWRPESDAHSSRLSRTELHSSWTYCVCILLGISPASNFGKPTFRNPVSVPSSRAGEIPKRIHTIFNTRRKFEIKYSWTYTSATSSASPGMSWGDLYLLPLLIVNTTVSFQILSQSATAYSCDKNSVRPTLLSCQRLLPSVC